MEKHNIKLPGAYVGYDVKCAKGYLAGFDFEKSRILFTNDQNALVIFNDLKSACMAAIFLEKAGYTGLEILADKLPEGSTDHVMEEARSDYTSRVVLESLHKSEIDCSLDTLEMLSDHLARL